MSTISPIGILCYPNLFTPRKNDLRADGDEEFSCTLVFPPEAQETEAFKAMKTARNEAAREKWGDKIPANLRDPIRSIDQSEKLAQQSPEGSVFVRFKSTGRPSIIDGACQDIEVPSDVYAGQHARVSFGAYGYDVNGNRGVAFGLNNVQITKLTGVERLDGRRPARDEFDAVAGAESTASDDEEDVFA